MPIDIQVKSFLFSLVFGFFFSAFLRINYRYMYKGPLIFEILINFLFVIDNILLYFIILKRLNDGIIHGYFILMILLGFVIMEQIFKKVPFDLKAKKWYNHIIRVMCMARKITKQTKRRLFLILMLTATTLLAFSFNLYTLLSQIIGKNREAVILQQQIVSLEDEEAYLKVEVEKLNDPDYVARYARERYLYSKDGEFTIRIPEAK